MGEDRRGERAEQSFEVIPTRIGGPAGRARSDRWRRAPIIIVIAIAILVPMIAWIGPRIEWRPEIDLSFLQPTPTPAPSKTPRPVFSVTPGLATPAPALTVGDGPHPTEPLAVDVGGLRLADPTTGKLGPTMGLRGDNDAIFRSRTGDGWWCVCFIRASEANQETATVEIKHVDSAGRELRRSTIGTYTSVAPMPAQDFYNRFDLEVSPDQQTAYLASATRSGAQWSMAVETIDLAALQVVARTELGTVVIPPVPGPTPSPDEGTIENYFAGPNIRLSPDGRRLVVWAWVDTGSSSGASTQESPEGWLIDLAARVPGGSVGLPTPLGPELATRLRPCYWVTWVTVDELAAICWPASDVDTTVTLSLLSPEGTERRTFDLFDSTGSWLADPILDRVNRRIVIWQPNDHTLRRLDLASGKIDVLKVDPAATVVDRSGSGTGGPGSGPVPEWVSFASDSRLYYSPQLLAEPGSTRVFALGVVSDGGRNYSPATSGVWVFDTSTVTLLDRWPAIAAYTNIGLSADGRWLLAAGASGFDEDGKQTAWESSITVHDVSDGRPALQFGRLGIDAQVFQVPP